VKKKKQKATITPRQIRAALKKGAKIAEELDKQLKPMFRLNASDRNLILD
jgi:hypothetical protein